MNPKTETEETKLDAGDGGIAIPPADDGGADDGPADGAGAPGPADGDSFGDPAADPAGGRAFPAADPAAGPPDSESRDNGSYRGMYRRPTAGDRVVVAGGDWPDLAGKSGRVAYVAGDGICVDLDMGGTLFTTAGNLALALTGDGTADGGMIRVGDRVVVHVDDAGTVVDVRPDGAGGLAVAVDLDPRAGIRRWYAPGELALADDGADGESPRAGDRVVVVAPDHRDRGRAGTVRPADLGDGDRLCVALDSGTDDDGRDTALAFYAPGELAPVGTRAAAEAAVDSAVLAAADGEARAALATLHAAAPDPDRLDAALARIYAAAPDPDRLGAAVDDDGVDYGVPVLWDDDPGAGPIETDPDSLELVTPDDGDDSLARDGDRVRLGARTGTVCYGADGESPRAGDRVVVVAPDHRDRGRAGTVRPADLGDGDRLCVALDSGTDDDGRDTALAFYAPGELAAAGTDAAAEAVGDRAAPHLWPAMPESPETAAAMRRESAGPAGAIRGAAAAALATLRSAVGAAKPVAAAPRELAPPDGIESDPATRIDSAVATFRDGPSPVGTAGPARDGERVRITVCNVGDGADDVERCYGARPDGRPFEIGDRVRVAETSPTAWAGAAGMVTTPDDAGTIGVEIGDAPAEVWFPPDDIEFVAPGGPAPGREPWSVGARVHVLTHGGRLATVADDLATKDGAVILDRHDARLFFGDAELAAAGYPAAPERVPAAGDRVSVRDLESDSVGRCGTVAEWAEDRPTVRVVFDGPGEPAARMEWIAVADLDLIGEPPDAPGFPSAGDHVIVVAGPSAARVGTIRELRPDGRAVVETSAGAVVVDAAAMRPAAPAPALHGREPAAGDGAAAPADDARDDSC